MIAIDDFFKVEMKVGEVVEANCVEGSEKLIKLLVDFGPEKRIIFTGVRQWYQPDYFLGKKFIFCTNLEPKKIMEEESQGMILAAEKEDGTPVFIAPVEDSQAGDLVR